MAPVYCRPGPGRHIYMDMNPWSTRAAHLQMMADTLAAAIAKQLQQRYASRQIPESLDVRERAPRGAGVLSF
jgi:hypothetical protein